MATADYPRDAQFQPQPAGDGRTDDAASVLQRNLHRLTVRRNRQRMWRELVRAAVWGAGLAALMVLAYRCYLVDGAWWVPVLAVMASLIVGFRSGLLHRAGPFATALEADQSLGLDERLSSALAFVDPSAVRRQRHIAHNSGWLPRVRAALLPHREFATSPASLSTQLVPALVQDAATRSAQLNPRQLYPTRLDRSAKLLLLFGGLLTLFCLMPNIEWFRSMEQRHLATVLQQQGKALEAVVKTVQNKKEAQNEPQTQELTRRLSALAHKLQRGRMTKKTALVEMGQLHKDLEKAAKSSESQGAASPQQLQQMAQALQDLQMESTEGRQMQEQLAQHNYEKAAQQLEKLADKLEKGGLKPEEREKTAQDLEKAAQALRQQGGQQHESAAQQLEQAAKALRQQQQGGQQKNGQQQGQSQQQGQGKKQGQGQQQGQGKQGQQQGQQKNGQQGGQQSQQSGGQQSGQANAQGGASALRQMAQGLRQGGSANGGSQSLRDMLNKIQQAEKDTGSNSGSQSGDKPGQGKAGEGKSGEGKGLTPGKDLAVTDPHTAVRGGAGLGPRNHARGSAAGGGVSRTRTNRTGEKRRWQDEWSDNLPKTKRKLDRVTGKYSAEGETEQLQTQGEAQNGEVHTPYYKVDQSHLRDAEDAISKDAVPPAYKQPVKDYFESLKSEGK